MSPRSRLVMLASRGSGRERDADEISISPYQSAFADSPKIVERQIEVERKQVEAVQANARALVGRIANVQLKTPARPLKNKSAPRPIGVRPFARCSVPRC
jgi:hypothetical protein